MPFRQSRQALAAPVSVGIRPFRGALPKAFLDPRMAETGAKHLVKKKKAFCALGAMIFFGASLLVFILAIDEQSVISNGSAAAEKIRLQDLTARNSKANQHVELLDFYFGKQYIFATKMVQFRDVYLPVFPNGQPETASNLQLLVWIRNDRNSNEPLIQTQQDLDRFVTAFSRNPRSVSGILRRPTNTVQKLTAEAYPGLSNRPLQVLWARHFPEQSSVDVLWFIFALCLVVTVGFAIAYRRQP